MVASTDRCQRSVDSYAYFDFIISGVKRYKMQKAIFMVVKATVNKQLTAYSERFRLIGVIVYSGSVFEKRQP